MPGSDQIYNELQGLMSQYDQYTPVDPADVTREFMNKVDNFRPQYQQAANMRANAYAAPATMMNDYYKNFGGEAGTGPGAMARLQSILSNVGQQYGSADVMDNVIDTQKARIGDLANSSVNMYNSGRQALMDRYNMRMPLFNAALGKEESARARAAAAAGFGGFGGGAGGTMGGGGQDAQGIEARGNNTTGAIGELGGYLGRQFNNLGKMGSGAQRIAAGSLIGAPYIGGLLQSGLKLYDKFNPRVRN